MINDNNQGPRPVEVVGVVEDVRQAALDAPPSFEIYLPLRQIHVDSVPFLRDSEFWMVRTNTATALRESFLRQLRAMPGGKAPKVFFCTTENDMSHITQALETGADEFIMKPFDAEILSSKLALQGLA